MRKVKKFTIITLIFCFLFSNICVKANIVSKNDLNVDARSAIAIDCKTRMVLFDKNSKTLIPIASTTKIMTTLVAIKYGNLDKKIEISSKAASIHGSTVGYKKGEKITLRELLYGLMLRSGNDAAIAISEGVAGSVEEFVNLMNEYALEIGLSSTHFESPHGLDSENHYSTAYDLALATTKAKENKLFNDIVGSKDVDAKTYGFTRSYHNINKILYQLPEANGVKTGYTGNAGKCLVTSANYEGRDIVIVVLNCTPRWQETIKIFNYVKKNYEYKLIYKKGTIIDEVPVEKSKEKAILYSDETIELPLKKNEEYKIIIEKSNSLEAPINKNDIIGRLCVYYQDQLIYTTPLKSLNTIKNKPGFKL